MPAEQPTDFSFDGLSEPDDDAKLAVVMPSRFVDRIEGETYVRWSARAVRKLLAQVREEGIAEGLRQATEGWEREWGTRDADGYVFAVEEGEGEKRAQSLAAWPKDRPGTVVSRLVGPWEPAKQPEPARAYALVDAEGRCGCCYGTGEHRCGHECYSCDGSGRDPDSPVCHLPHGERCSCAPPVGAGGQ